MHVAGQPVFGSFAHLRDRPNVITRLRRGADRQFTVPPADRPLVHQQIVRDPHRLPAAIPGGRLPHRIPPRNRLSQRGDQAEKRNCPNLHRTYGIAGRSFLPP